jgi:hypothetical protein
VQRRRPQNGPVHRPDQLVDARTGKSDDNYIFLKLSYETGKDHGKRHK